MEYRSLSLQENFGTVPVRSFSTTTPLKQSIFTSCAQGGAVSFGSAIHPVSNVKPILDPVPFTTINQPDITQPSSIDTFILLTAVGIVLGVSIILYYQYHKRKEKRDAAAKIKTFTSHEGFQ